MRSIRTAAFVIGTLLSVPAIGLAATPAGATRTRETMGVVRFVDPTTLEIRRLPQLGERTMRFTVNRSTQVDRRLRVGATVDVRYRTEDNRRIATGVMVEHAKQRPSISGSHQ